MKSLDRPGARLRASLRWLSLAAISLWATPAMATIVLNIFGSASSPINAGNPAFLLTSVFNSGTATSTASISGGLSAAGVNVTAVSWVCNASGGATCTASGTGGTFSDTATIPPGGTVTYSMTATTDPLLLTSFGIITMGLTASDPNANAVIFSGSPQVVVTGSDDFGVSITDGAASAVPGMPITYTITVGSVPSPSQTLGIVTASLTNLVNPSWTCSGSCTSSSGLGDIAALVTGPAVFTVNGTVNPNLTGTLSMTASVFPQIGTDPNGGNNSATDTDTLTPQVDLSATITDGVTSLVPGTPVTYTINVNNSGPSTASGATIIDSLPAILQSPTWACSATSGSSCTTLTGVGSINDAGSIILPGGTLTYMVNATVSSAALGSLSNTVTVTAPVGETDTNPGNNSATDTDTLTPQSNLAITVTDGVTTAVPGGSVTYTITASNTGPNSAIGAVVSDTFPAALTATWACVGAGGGTCGLASGSGNISDTVTLPVGGSVTYTVSASINASATGTLSNTATIAVPAGWTDTSPANNSATDTDTLTPQANLAITVTDGVTTAVPGTSVTYTITASNSGPSAATGATVADTFPAALTVTWTCVGAGGGTCSASGSGNINNSVNLPVGASVTYTASAAINAAATGSISNTATISAPGGVTDPTPGNNSATDTDTLTPQGDLSITVTDGVSSAVPGGSITYTITATNVGPSAVTGATISDLLPAGLTASWTTATAGGAAVTSGATGSGNISATVNLPVGGTVTFTAPATISAALTGIISNTATITAPGGTTDPNLANNAGTDTDTLTPQADLAITLTDGVTTAIPTGSVTYTITASNSGPSDAIGATVTDSFPAVLTATWTCVGAGGGTCGAASGSGNIADTVNLPVGASVTYTAIAQVSVAATGTLTNTAVVGAPAGVTDTNLANNTATDTDALALYFSGPSATGTGTITVIVTGGGGTCSWVSPQFIGPPPGSPPIPPTAPSLGAKFPQGLFDFGLTGCAVGSTVTITITYPQSIAGTRYWKYGPTSSDPSPHWYIFPAVISGNTATLTITDGGLGDDDLAANGTIDDQGGPGTSTDGIPTLSEWMLALLALMLLATGAKAARRRGL